MRRKIRSKGGLFVLIALGVLGISFGVFYAEFTKRVEKPITTTYSVADLAFRDSLASLVGPGFVPGNEVHELVNGVRIFPAMIEDIGRAEKTITLETYIWESGAIGGKFVQALCDRAKAGVKVHVIVDGMGTLKLNDEDVDRMKKAGVQFMKYGRDRWYKVKWNINHRTHRKLLVIDGKVGYIGGVCISDKWDGNAESLDRWRDTHFRVEGPVVREMQGVFVDNWLKTTGEVLHGAEYFPEDTEEKGGGMWAQCFKSGPRDAQETARLVHLYAMAAARKSIRLSHAYFVPDELAVKTIVAARARGVQVEVIVPGKNDSAIGRAASRSTWKPLIEAGVKFYAYEPALYHCKVMIVDDVFVTGGSVNFDNRSFRLNDEVNINVLDEKFAAAQVKVFEADKSKSRVIDPAEITDRSWFGKGIDQFAGMFRAEF
jgi:cardiolipin synthase